MAKLANEFQKTAAAKQAEIQLIFDQPEHTSIWKICLRRSNGSHINMSDTTYCDNDNVEALLSGTAGEVRFNFHRRFLQGIPASGLILDAGGIACGDSKTFLGLQYHVRDSAKRHWKLSKTFDGST
jgi:hypothetical protein